MKYLIIIISVLGINKVCVANNLSVCNNVANTKHIQFLNKAELKYGQKIEDRNKAVKLITSCLNKNEACVAGFIKKSSEIQIWNKKTKDSHISGNYKKDDEILFAVLQLTNDNACVVASRLLVRAQPWYIKVFKKKNGIIQETDELSSFPTFANMSPTPSELVDSLKLAYNYWKTKTVKKEKRRLAREKRLKEMYEKRK